MGKTAKLNTVKRKAEIGESILITDAQRTFGGYKNGDMRGVVGYYGNEGVHVDSTTVFISHEEYEVIVGETSDNLDGLSEQAAELIAKIRRQSYANGYAKGCSDTLREEQTKRFDKAFEKVADVVRKYAEQDARTTLRMATTSAQERSDGIDEQAKRFRESYEESFVERTDQERRDITIGNAKRDVRNRIEDGTTVLITNYGNMTYSARYYNVEFHVNKEKRVVTALVKDVSNNGVLEKGFAKCAPGDCFNVHIGKAIALRRALGLRVLDEYYDVPQPAEVRVGDVVKYSGTREARVVDKFRLGMLRGETHLDTALAFKAEIIDDSRDEVAE